MFNYVHENSGRGGRNLIRKDAFGIEWVTTFRKVPMHAEKCFSERKRSPQIHVKLPCDWQLEALFFY